MSVHQNLKRIREQRKLSQQDVANLLHITQTAYSLIETNKTKIDERRIHQLADILGVPFTELMADNGMSSIFAGKVENSYDALIQTLNASNKELKELMELLKAELSIKNEQINMLHKLLDRQ
jgi:transcriptional regulator with XRE-family HTH domain